MENVIFIDFGIDPINQSKYYLNLYNNFGLIAILKGVHTTKQRIIKNSVIKNIPF